MSTSPATAETWIYVEEAAAILQRGSRSVHGYAERGRLRIRREGKRSLFLREEVEQLATELVALTDASAAARPAPPSQATPTEPQETLRESIDVQCQLIWELGAQVREVAAEVKHLQGRLDAELQQLGRAEFTRLEEVLNGLRDQYGTEQLTSAATARGLRDLAAEVQRRAQPEVVQALSEEIRELQTQLAAVIQERDTLQGQLSVAAREHRWPVLGQQWRTYALGLMIVAAVVLLVLGLASSLPTPW